MEVKRKCRACKLIKPIEEFGKNARSYRGIENWCRACQSEYQAEYRRKRKMRNSVSVHGDAYKETTLTVLVIDCTACGKQVVGKPGEKHLPNVFMGTVRFSKADAVRWAACRASHIGKAVTNALSSQEKEETPT